ncbi:MAG: glycine--tRNA ligase subunit beta [Acidobacteria bacterium]|nr:glycine--tRNA ligase subunit beta [Acidobacteriota bacterium]
MSEFLLEVGTEEIPARMMHKAADDLKNGIEAALTQEGISFTDMTASAAPRQLVVAARNIQLQQQDREEQVLGPPVRIAYQGDGSPSQALLGFLRKNPDLSESELTRVEQPKGEVVAAIRAIKGRPTCDLLAEIVPAVLESMTFAKNMRWGMGETLFVRPVRNLLALLDGKVIPFNFAGVETGDTSFGHRFHGARQFKVTGIDDFDARKKANGIVNSHEERKASIEQQIQSCLNQIQGRLVPDPHLLAEVTDLVECPYVVLGEFDRQFLSIPKEILITSLRSHQKSFCIQDEKGELMPYFLSLASVPKDGGLIKKGNEWVLKARLWDAQFFWASDCSKELSTLKGKLANLTFQTELGSYLDKVKRIETQVVDHAHAMGWNEATKNCAQKAASFAKADLMSELVFEFPELQGVIGGLLLRAKGEPELVWRAVYEHYQPVGTEDALPATQTGALVSLVDKLDTLVGCFSMGLIPTGTRDPYALRRAALGIIQILMEGNLPLDLGNMVSTSIAQYGADGEVLTPLVMDFFADRIRYLLKRMGYAHDLIEATMVPGFSRVDLVLKRAEAIQAQMEKTNFRSLALNLKRMRNVIADELSDLTSLDEGLLEVGIERDLWHQFKEVRSAVDGAISHFDYNRAMDLMNQLAEPVDLYFSPGGVFVNVDDSVVRRNRKAMMRDMLVTLGQVGELSQLETK